VGGFAWAWTKCKACNEFTGSEIEAGLVDDVSVRLAVDALADVVPKLAERFDKRDPLVARTSGELVRARRRDEDLQILTTRNDDGSLTRSRESARAAIETRLRRERRSGDEVEAGLTLFDQAAEGVPVQIGDHVVTHRSVERFGPSFEGGSVGDAFPALVAFHFMALGIGSHIYGSELDVLRESIRSGEPRSEWCQVERGIGTRDQASPYVAEHLVGFAQTQPYLAVRVQLFGWNLWRVHFPRIASRGERLGLLLSLDSETLNLVRPQPSSTPLSPPA
jgi:hypothetical protein